VFGHVANVLRALCRGAGNMLQERRAGRHGIKVKLPLLLSNLRGGGRAFRDRQLQRGSDETGTT
jgi:hypothetical protein